MHLALRVKKLVFGYKKKYSKNEILISGKHRVYTFLCYVMFFSNKKLHYNRAGQQFF